MTVSSDSYKNTPRHCMKAQVRLIARYISCTPGIGDNALDWSLSSGEKRD